MAGKRLTAKQAAFVQEYLVDLNAKQAAVRAGYSERMAYSIGSRFLVHPDYAHVAAAVAEAMAARAERTEDSADQVIRDLLDLYRRAIGDGDYKAAAKCIELRGKHLGMWKERRVHEGPDGGPVQMVLRWQGPEADEDLAKLQQRWTEDDEEA